MGVGRRKEVDMGDKALLGREAWLWAKRDKALALGEEVVFSCCFVFALLKCVYQCATSCEFLYCWFSVYWSEYIMWLRLCG